MPEPILTETVTDIDGHEAGEFEFEANGSTWRAVRGGAYELQGSVEGEWLVTRHFGIRGEPFYSSALDPGATGSHGHVGISLAASWKVLQDFHRDFHVQVEAGGRVPLESATVVEPGEPTLPLALDVRGAWRHGPFTVRLALGVEAGGTFAHAPVRGGIGVLTPFVAERYGFWGVELDADFARSTPAVLALNLVPNLTPLRLPFKVGLAVPWALGADGSQPSVGIFLRLFIESSREIAYGTQGRGEPGP